MLSLRKIRTFALLLCTAIGLAQFTLAAHAQKMDHPGGKGGPPDDAAAIEKKKKAREIDEAYKATLKTIPAKPKPDPWGAMRSK